MASMTPIGTNEHLYGSTSCVPFLPAEAVCCRYHTFIFRSRDRELLLFGHLHSCTVSEDLMNIEGERFFAIYPEGPFDGPYPVIETLASVPLLPRLDYDGRPITWYVRSEEIKHLLTDSEVVKYEKKGDKKNGQRKDDNNDKKDKEAKGNSERIDDNEGDGKKDNSKGSDMTVTHAGTSFNADGEDVAGSGVRARRMTRGQDELVPQLQAFSSLNQHEIPATQSSKHRSPLTNSTNADIRQPLQICPYHETGRCEVDDPNWFDQQRLFDRDHHPADSCATVRPTQSYDPGSPRTGHHSRSYLNPNRVTNYRPARVELHQENAREDTDADVDDEQILSLGGRAFPGGVAFKSLEDCLFPGSPFGSDDSPSPAAAKMGKSCPTIDTTGYKTADRMTYAPQVTNNADVPVSTLPRRTPATSNAVNLSHEKIILLRERCRCIKFTVRDIGQAIEEAPFVWQYYCREHNPNADGQQPSQIYAATHGSTPPYHEILVTASGDPRPRTTNPTLGLRGGALGNPDIKSPLSGRKWTSTSAGTESHFDYQTAEPATKWNNSGSKSGRPQPDSDKHTTTSLTDIVRNRLSKFFTATSRSKRSAQNTASSFARGRGLNSEGFWETRWEEQGSLEKLKNLKKLENTLNSRFASIDPRKAERKRFDEMPRADKTVFNDKRKAMDTFKNSFMKGLILYGQDICNMAGELDKFSFASDAPVATSLFEATYEQHITSTLIAPELVPNAGKITAANKVSGLSLRGGQPDIDDEQADLITPFIHERSKAVHESIESLLKRGATPGQEKDFLNAELASLCRQMDDTFHDWMRLNDELDELKEEIEALLQELACERALNDVNRHVLAHFHPHDVLVAEQVVAQLEREKALKAIYGDALAEHCHLSRVYPDIGASTWKCPGSPLSLRGGFHPQPSSVLLKDGEPSPTEYTSERQRRHDAIRKTTQKQASAFVKESLPDWWKHQVPDAERVCCWGEQKEGRG